MYIIGYVLKPHGIKGEVKINPVSPRLERFKYLKNIYIDRDSKRTYSIEHLRISGGFIYLKLHQIGSRDEAEDLRGSELLIDESQLIELEDDEYFIHDLIGCVVEDETGKILGSVTDVWQNSSNDIYVVKSKTGKELLLPAIKNVLKSIEIENKKIIVHLLEGLID
jgi:16S rRNA processing protein RimM